MVEYPLTVQAKLKYEGKCGSGVLDSKLALKRVPVDDFSDQSERGRKKKINAHTRENIDIKK